jgi:transposase
MLIPMSHVKVHMAVTATDMRWGFDRLASVCKDGLGLDPYSGHLYLFLNRARDRARIIYFDGSGSCVFSKRLEKGTFKVPPFKAGDATVKIAATDLALLLEGVNVSAVYRPEPWRPTTRQPDDALNI